MGATVKMHTKGLPPREESIAGVAIERRLKEEEARRSADHAAARSDDPAFFAASDAYGCTRKVALGRLGVPKDIQYDAATLMTFRVGDWYHQVTQESLVQALDCRCEVDFDWRPTFSLWGRCDGVYEPEWGKTVVEIKSQSGYGFDLATGAKKSAEGPGPKIDHLIQAGMAAMSPTIDASHVHIIYINKDRGVVAEWVIGINEELPHLEGRAITELVYEEFARLGDIKAELDEGLMPARMVPGYGFVDDPPEKDSRDNPWNCRYCSWQPSCAKWAGESFAFTQDNKRRIVVTAEEAS